MCNMSTNSITSEPFKAACTIAAVIHKLAINKAKKYSNQ